MQHSKENNYLILTVPSQTGDVYQIAGALALRPEVDVLVICQNAAEALDPVFDFYKQAAHDVSRVQRFIFPEKARGYAAKTVYNLLSKPSGLKGALEKPDGLQTYWGTAAAGSGKIFVTEFIAPYNPKKIGPPGYATTIIAEEFKAKPKDAPNIIIGQLSSQSLKYKDLAVLIAEGKFGSFPNPNANPKPKILLLWSRYTGKNKPDGYNPEGDSDPFGQSQLLAIASDKKFTVVRIGHYPDSQENQEDGEEKLDPPPLDLGEFYTKDALVDKSRAGQLTFFLALKHLYPGIVQMGQKSGGMDGPALIGIPTLYIEDGSSPQRERMDQWTKKGVVPFYRRAKVDFPPSPLGKALRLLDKTKPNLNGENIRLIAKVFALQTVKNHNQPPDVETVKSTVQKLNQNDIADWENQFKEASLDPSENAVWKGYTQSDCTVIEKALEGLLAELPPLKK